nr:glutamate receptor 1.1 [Quercus suber]
MALTPTGSTQETNNTKAKKVESQNALNVAKEVKPVGVVLDLGRVAESYMSMARSNFYAVNHNYRPRLTLFGKDSGDDVITAASTGSL